LVLYFYNHWDELNECLLLVIVWSSRQDHSIALDEIRHVLAGWTTSANVESHPFALALELVVVAVLAEELW